MDRETAEFIAARVPGATITTTWAKGRFGVLWAFGPFALAYYGEQVAVRAGEWQPIDAMTTAGLHGLLVEIESALADARAAGVLSPSRDESMLDEQFARLQELKRTKVAGVLPQEGKDGE